MYVASLACILATMDGLARATLLVSRGSPRTSNRHGALLLHTWQLGGTVTPEAEPCNRAWRAVGELAVLSCLWQYVVAQGTAHSSVGSVAWRELGHSSPH